MFECSLTCCILWVIWYIILWTEWYNYACFWCFYDDKAKIFCRGFAAIDNLYITIYRSGISKKNDVGEHMGVLSSIQLCSANFYGSWVKFFALVSTYKSAEVLEKILWIINYFF